MFDSLSGAFPSDSESYDEICILLKGIDIGIFKGFIDNNTGVKYHHVDKVGFNLYKFSSDWLLHRVTLEIYRTNNYIEYKTFV